MTSLGELRLDATIENLRTISHFIHAVGERLELTEEVLFAIDLAVGEAATNIVQHAYVDDIQGSIQISVETIDNMLHITLMDWGSPFKIDDIQPFDINAPIEDRIYGGMGLHFIENLMDEVVRYVSTEIGIANSLKLSKRIMRLKPGYQRSSTARELNAILRISHLMSTTVDLDELLERILNELVSAIDAERGTIYLIDEEQGELFSRILLENEGVLKEIRVKIGEGVAGQVAETGEVLNIEDVNQYSGFNSSFDELTGYKTQTILAAPMRNHYEKIIGVVQLLNKRGGYFSPRDERLLIGMASQAAVSVENARLYEQEIQQQLINQELDTARSIQRSFLPDEIPEYDGWDIAAYWNPVYEVAGDFYDFFYLPDNRLAIVIADVSGKGVPASLFMALSVTVLRFAIRLGFSPSEMLKQGNKFILENQKSKMFTTVFAIYLDFGTGDIKYASAGHNPPLLYRQDTQETEYLSTLGVAMGVFDDARFEEEQGRMNVGDILILYTDGVTEAINAEEEEFGEERLQSIVKKNADLSAQKLIDVIMSEFKQFVDDAFDDETLVIIKRDIIN